MKSKILIGIVFTGLLLVIGCQKPRARATMQDLLDCEKIPAYQWNNDEQICKPMTKNSGCIQLGEWEYLKTPNLPIGFENITDNFEDDKTYFEINIFCTEGLIKPNNITCREYMGGFTSYYWIENGNEPIELCWRLQDEIPHK